MFQAIRSNSNNQLLPCVVNDDNHQLFYSPIFKTKSAVKHIKGFIGWTFAETIWGRAIKPTTLLQTLIAGSKDVDNDTTLCYTLPTVDTDKHWPQLFNQTLNWTSREAKVTHLQSSTTKIQPQQSTHQQRQKQQIFSMSCQLFYTTKRTKFEYTRSFTQEAAWQYFPRRELINFAFRKKHVNRLSWK